jgi:DMSO/TMAO reductase YedYZ molybdopterin-dependent catalytic subunit
MNTPETSREVLLSEVQRRSRRGFLTALVASAAAISGWFWARTRAEDGHLPWPFRRVLEANEKIWRRMYNPTRTGAMPPVDEEEDPRVNGDIGLAAAVDARSWRLSVGPHSLTLADLKALPRTEATVLFKCIEGWSQEMSYAGVRFSDFVRHYQLGTRSGEAPNVERPGDLFPFVGLRTPDGLYYVSVDRESMWHPNTVLAYEMNGAPLSEENGAPLRLMIPVKYGIKNLKRIGTIVFADTRPPDYWHERGYDWYAGL